MISPTRLSIFFLLIAFALLALFCPALVLFFKAFTLQSGGLGLGNFKAYFNSSASGSSLLHSLFVSSVASTLALFLASIFAYFILRSSVAFKKVLGLIALLPLFAPTMTHGIALIYIFGRQGIFTRYFGIDVDIYGAKGIILADILYTFPIAYLIIALVLRYEDFRLYESAYLAGVKPWRIFAHITLPALRYSLITAFLISFVLCFSDFGAAKMIGGGYNVLATDIYKEVVGSQDLYTGSAVAILLLLPALFAFVIDTILSRRSVTTSLKATHFFVRKNPLRDILSGVYLYGIAALILAVVAVIILASLFVAWPYDTSLCLASYHMDFMGESIYYLVANSLFVAVFVAALGTILAFLSAYFIERDRQQSASLVTRALKKFGYFLALCPNALPGLTIGLAYIFFYNASSNPLSFIYGGFSILILAGITHFFTTPFITLMAALKKLDPEYESMCVALGVPLPRYLLQIASMCKEALGEAFIYFFINAMITISCVIFLYTSDTNLLSIAMISKSDNGDVADASAIACMIVAINIALTLFVRYGVLGALRALKMMKLKAGLRRSELAHALKLNGSEVLGMLNEAASKAHAKYWLEFGTLLGRVRDNDFIGHDINLDIGIAAKDFSAEFMLCLEASGFKREGSLALGGEWLASGLGVESDSHSTKVHSTKADLNNQGVELDSHSTKTDLASLTSYQVRNVCYSYKGIYIYIYIFATLNTKGGRKIITFYKSENGYILRYALSASPLKKSAFLNKGVYIPLYETRRLFEIYGDSYLIEDPNWQDSENENIARLKMPPI